jgi:hypothetical protein
VYAQLLRNPRLRRAMFYRLLVDMPYLAYDELSRVYFVHFLVDSPAQMSTVAIVIGVSTLVNCAGNVY